MNIEGRGGGGATTQSPRLNQDLQGLNGSGVCAMYVDGG